MEIKNPVENVLEQTLKNLRSIIDVDCIVGEPLKYDGATIIPISKVTVGFVSGGGEYNNNKKKKHKELTYQFAGGSGGGCNLTPIGFLVVIKDKVEFLKVDCESNFEKVLDLASNVIKSFK